MRSFAESYAHDSMCCGLGIRPQPSGSKRRNATS